MIKYIIGLLMHMEGHFMTLLVIRFFLEEINISLLIMISNLNTKLNTQQRTILL